jgi:hypothetical protein
MQVQIRRRDALKSSPSRVIGFKRCTLSPSILACHHYPTGTTFERVSASQPTKFLALQPATRLPLTVCLFWNLQVALLQERRRFEVRPGDRSTGMTQRLRAAMKVNRKLTWVFEVLHIFGSSNSPTGGGGPVHVGGWVTLARPTKLSDGRWPPSSLFTAEQWSSAGLYDCGASHRSKPLGAAWP